MAETKVRNSQYLGRDTLEEKDVPTPDYTPAQKEYLDVKHKQLSNAKTQREQPFPEFDHMTYDEYWQSNERGANTTIKALKNKADMQFQSGTLRTKLEAFLSNFQTLNLSPEISAYNEDEIPVSGLGSAMETIIAKTEQVDQDREKKLLRQYELLKQGTVFVEEVWQERTRIDKEILSGELGEFNGVKIKWERNEGDGKPERHIISGLGVYLADLGLYNIDEQPYIYTVKTMDYESAKGIYGEWEMWKHVSRQHRSFDPSVSDSLTSGDFRVLDDLKRDQVEVVKMQSNVFHANEYQVFLNGIPMLPMGFPLTEVSPDGMYTIAQQNLGTIRHNFAYGKSFIFDNKNLVQVLDEMLRMSVLKTQKSFMPPYLNFSGKTLSKEIFMPGTMTRGVGRGTVTPVSEHEAKGVTAAEFNMIGTIKDYIDENTVSPTFTGQQEQGSNVTATQIIEVQRQARMMMALLTLSATLLEWKLARKRLRNLLANYFNPVDIEMDQARGLLNEVYRTTSYRGQVEDEGPGVKMVIARDQLPTAQEVRAEEKSMSRKFGSPVKIAYLSPKALQKTDYIWVININPRPAQSSEASKLMFRAEVEDAMMMGLQPNPEYLQKRFAEVWEEDPNKMFGGMQPQQPEQPQSRSRSRSPSVNRPQSPRVSPSISQPRQAKPSGI